MGREREEYTYTRDGGKRGWKEGERKGEKREKTRHRGALVNGLKGYREPVGGRRAETVGWREEGNRFEGGPEEEREGRRGSEVNHRVTRPTRTPFASVPTGAILP